MTVEQAPPCEADSDDDLLRCAACGIAEGGGPDGAIIMFDMLNGEYRCGECFPDDNRYDDEPRRDH